MAATTAFRAATHSPTHGYTRINHELAKSLLALNRAREAVAPLQSALRGGVEGSELYLTRTEIHDLLARAFEAAGQKDSAAAHYSIVERAWRNADPRLAARYHHSRSRLLALGRASRLAALPAVPN